jgi:hypothetical protein
MEELKFDIGTKRSPTIGRFSEFKGQKLFDLRKYFESKDDPDELIPTKKGISLNELQFRLLLEALNSKSREIEMFFESKDELHINLEIIQSIGRDFDMAYENGESRLRMNESLASKLSPESTLMFTIIIDSFYKSLIDVVEDSDEIEMIMDGLNRRLKRHL